MFGAIVGLQMKPEMRSLQYAMTILMAKVGMIGIFK
jgi:hypothetical protein